MEDSVLKKLLYSEKPEYSLQQFRELPENQDLVGLPGEEQATKLRKRWRAYNNENKRKTLGDILLGTQEQAIKLLAGIDPQAEALVNRLAEIEKNIEGLAGLYEITQKGWGPSNVDRPGSQQGRQEFIDLQTEKASINNQLNQMVNALRGSALDIANAIGEHETLTNQVTDHYLYIKNKMDELLDPNFKEDTESEEDTLDTKGAEIPLDEIVKQSKDLGMYLNSSPIVQLWMRKTTGSHLEALREYEEMQKALSKGKKIDPVKYAHVQSQLRLFQFLPKLYKGKKGTSNFKYNMDNYRFMVVNKNIIPKDLQDKITFYDPATKSFKYAKDMQGPITKEDKESI